MQSLTNDSYDDTWDKNRPTYSASISSKFVKNGFVPLYLPYIALSDDEVIQAICPELKPAKTGIFFFGSSDPVRNKMDADATLSCHAKRFKIYVNDSLFSNLNYRFHEHPKRKNIGLIAILDVGYLSRGEHAIKVGVKLPENRNGKDTLVFRETVLIPFWKE